MIILIDNFLHHLTAERRLSPLTIRAYRRDLELLLAFCRQQEIHGWDKLDSAHLRALLGRQRREGKSPATARRLLAAIRSFYGFLRGNDLVDRDPTIGISAPKQARQLPDVLDVDQVLALLDTPPGGQEVGDGNQQHSALLIRDWAILELLYSSGLRLAELVTLDLTSLDLREGLVRVTGKGGKTRIVPVGRMACRAIDGWLGVRSHLAPPDETALFVSWQKKRLSARSVQARVQKWGGEANLHPHLFRHCFASHLLESSGDLRAVQELLGHADISATQIYTHLDFQHLASVYDGAHPRARKKQALSRGKCKL